MSHVINTRYLIIGNSASGIGDAESIPFTVIIAHTGEMIGLTDRIRLRPLTVGETGNMLYLSSEESAIWLSSPELDPVWTPVGGKPVIGRPGSPLSSRRELAFAGVM